MQNNPACVIKAQVRDAYGIAYLGLPDGREFSLHRPDEIDIRLADKGLQNVYLHSSARVDQPLEVLYDSGSVPCQHQRVAKMKIGSVQLAGANAGFFGA